MAAAISAMALRIRIGPFGRGWMAVADFLDCAIPIALTAALAAGAASIFFGLVH
jgi:hypothetical protein